MEKLVKEWLSLIGEDPEREGLRQTPRRVAEAWRFFTRGYGMDPAEVISDALYAVENRDMVIVKDIEIYSLCEHHMVPFYGRCHVGYIPNGRVIGVSKLARLADVFARRLQLQERLTNQIATTMMDIVKPLGVAVVIEARHLCMMMRGVEKQNSVMVTSSMLGTFLKSDVTRKEFLSLIPRMQA